MQPPSSSLCYPSACPRACRSRLTTRRLAVVLVRAFAGADQHTYAGIASASSSSKSSQTKEEACAILDDKANAISSSLNEKDKASVIKTLSNFIDIMKSDEITNPEVKVAANSLANSAQKLLDATKAADDQPTAEQRSRILSATSEYLESMNSLQTVCTGK